MAKSKISWQAALKDYLADDQMSYQKLSQKYGVSIQAVKMKAAKGGWANLRRETRQNIDKLLPEKVGIERVQIQEEQYSLGKLEIRNAILAQQDHIVHEGQNAAHVVNTPCGLCDKGIKGSLVLAVRPTSYREALQTINSGIRHMREAYDMDKPTVTSPMPNQQNNYLNIFNKN